MSKKDPKLTTEKEAIQYIFGAETEEQISEGMSKEEILQLVREASEKMTSQAREDFVNNSSREILNELRAEFDARFSKIQPTIVEVHHKLPDGSTVKQSPTIQHFMFPVLLKYIEARTNVALVGPAGSGKTKASEFVAMELGLRFFPIPVGPQTPESRFLGYYNANGQYVRTTFREAYENGGVVLLDEFDAADPGVATIVNGATASDTGTGFPDGFVKRHPDFICICAMNTYGTGANRDYVGRNELDKATLNRFQFLEWPIDEQLEMTIAPNKSWCEWVQIVRQAVAELKIRHLVTPRATIEGAKVLAIGIPRSQVEQSALWQGLSNDDIVKIKTKAEEIKSWRQSSSN